MFKLHSDDGSTARVDLAEPEQAAGLRTRLEDPKQQARITGVSVAQGGLQVSLVRPRGFKESEVAFDCEMDDEHKVERTVLFSGDVRTTVVVYGERRAVRVQVERIGRRRLAPHRRTDDA